MLPQPISQALFDVRYKPTDVVLEYLCNAIEGLSYTISDIDNCDLAVTIKFGNTSTIGELRVDRLAQDFELTVRHKDFTFLPIRADWDAIINAIRKVSNGISTDWR